MQFVHQANKDALFRPKNFARGLRAFYAPKIFMPQRSLHAPSTNDLKALKLQSIKYRMYCPLYMNCGSFQGRVCNHVASNTTVYQKRFLL